MVLSSLSPYKEFAFELADFNSVRKRLQNIAGIRLGESKDSMVYSRLSRRIRHLKLHSFADYLSYLDNTQAERQEFVNALTTNLTSFFRENHHFEELKIYLRAQKNRRITIWCAAASTGEEAYSLAISAIEAFGRLNVPIKIIASDIDSRVLNIAKRGIYKAEDINGLDNMMKKRYFFRGTGNNAGMVKVIPELRELIEFKHINLMDEEWALPKNIDVVFCRNVMIYFDTSTQLKILTKLVSQMQPNGLYFAGHSEVYSQSNGLLKPLGKTIYRPKMNGL